MVTRWINKKNKKKKNIAVFPYAFRKDVLSYARWRGVTKNTVNDKRVNI
jgi:hypothetical protein